MRTTTFIFLLLTYVSSAYGETQQAVFAGGCFWCMEPAFDKVPGVVATTVGYTGGKAETATYDQVSAGRTKHREVIRVEYNPTEVSFAKLLEVFWKNVDPFDAQGQFCDKGLQYTSAIYLSSPEERAIAERSREEALQKALVKGSFATALEELSEFYPAEDYHQDYYKKNPLRYKFYRYNCGRDKRLRSIWGKEE